MNSANITSTTEPKRVFEFDFGKETRELNQYWYSPHTIDAFLGELRHHATACAFLSTPSLYFALLSSDGKIDCDYFDCRHGARSAVGLSHNSRLFEYDRQWENCPGFVHYDFHKPDQVPVQYFASFDYVVADPPFITKDVWTAYIETVKILLKPGGKVLFTTVMENHTMLESLFDAPLFIAMFFPAVVRLTYQYVCFTNYKVTRITEPNSELPLMEPNIMAAIQVANDLRESEQQFVIQMRQRERDGEQPLPTECHSAAMGVVFSEELPASVMKWNYVPPGLTMYANGGDVPPVKSDNNGDDYGDVYREIVTLRCMLEDFKRRIDLSQRHLDTLLKLQQRRARGTEQTEVSEDDATNVTAREQFAATLDEMRKIITSVNDIEARVAADDYPSVVSYINAMKDCVDVYATVPLQKNNLSELAADATRKYKSPIFKRMNELLQRMKEIKKEKSTKQAVVDNATYDD